MTTTDDDLAAVDLPPASERRGQHGHDTALERATGAQLLRWKVKGLSYDELAKRGGYADRAGARNALMRALERNEATAVTTYRELENAKHDEDEAQLRTVIRKAAKAGDLRLIISAVDARTRVAARRARLNGYDAPVQVQVSAGVQAQLADSLAMLEDLVNESLEGVVDVEWTEDPTSDPDEDARQL